MPARQGDARRLSRLAEVCRVREAGYRAAASMHAGRRLHVLLTVYAEQSRRFVTSLEQELWRLQPHPPTHSSTGAWDRPVPAGRTEDDVLEMCRHADTQALHAYEDCLDCDWPDDVRGLLLQQHHEIRTALRRLDSLREQAMSPYSLTAGEAG